jgi:rhodanese-related sulfurtransferase
MNPELIHNLMIFAQHNWMLLACFVFIVLLIIVEEGKSKGSGGGQVNPKAAISLMNDENALVIDVRSKEAFKRGHVVGSISMPKDQFDVESPRLKNAKDKAIIVVCVKGNDASRVALTLRKAGYDSKVLAGGIDAWKAAELPLKQKK